MVISGETFEQQTPPVPAFNPDQEETLDREHCANDEFLLGLDLMPDNVGC